LAPGIIKFVNFYQNVANPKISQSLSMVKKSRNKTQEWEIAMVISFIKLADQNYKKHPDDKTLSNGLEQRQSKFLFYLIN
jgi:hypothetical protein